MADQVLPRLPEARRGHASRVRLERCPQLRCFDGDPATGYELTLPLDPDGEIDALALSHSPSSWQVRRFEKGGNDLVGSLVRDRLGAWMARYDKGEASRSDCFSGSVRFRANSIINVVEGAEVWAYRVASVVPV
ncbi:hypothetical protein [Devosia sp. A16]|uniref:hypothetical protein n=1 Tax=Devosia sp. A16 TaxID=1736675 RepID=UPI0006D7748A|nr:hypothetical protein [Devosia sp. A16]